MKTRDFYLKFTRLTPSKGTTVIFSEKWLKTYRILREKLKNFRIFSVLFLDFKL